MAHIPFGAVVWMFRSRIQVFFLRLTASPENSRSQFFYFSSFFGTDGIVSFVYNIFLFHSTGSSASGCVLVVPTTTVEDTYTVRQIENHPNRQSKNVPEQRSVSRSMWAILRLLRKVLKRYLKQFSLIWWALEKMLCKSETVRLLPLTGHNHTHTHALNKMNNPVQGSIAIVSTFQ